MPVDHLNPATAPNPPTAVPTPEEISDGVLTVLAGEPLDQVAADLGIRATDLADAIETYQQAGQAALATQAGIHGWYQVHVRFPDWATAEHTAVTGLGPPLQRLHDVGLIAGWWFIRKAPCWRLRIRPDHNVEHTEVMTSANSILNALLTSGLISHWRQTRYEPETVVFGGEPGIYIAHELFCSDSSHIVTYLRQPEPAIGRRELSVLLCAALFHGAGQEWFECGDTWHRVTRLRPIPVDTPTDRLRDLTEDLRKLLSCAPRPSSALFGADRPLAFAGPWATAFDQAGQALRTAADEGNLERGTRDILAHHVIFHWNRIGLPYRAQSILAHAAKTATLGAPLQLGSFHPRRSSPEGIG